MGRTTKEINKITGAIISTSIRLILCSLVVLFLYEGATRGYAFGYEVFHPTAVAAAPGVDKNITIEKRASVSDVAKSLEKMGLIKNSYIFVIQSRLYNYEIQPGTYQLNTSMTSTEVLKKLDEEGQKLQEPSDEDAGSEPDTQQQDDEEMLENEETSE